MPWELLPIERYAEHAANWDALNAAGPDTPLLESRFVRQLLAHFGSGREVLALARSGDELEAAAILCPGPTRSWRTFQPSQAPLGLWLQRKPESLAGHAAGLAAALPSFSPMLAITQLDPLLVERPAETSTLQVLDYIQTARLAVSGDFPAYWAARGKNLRHNVKRQLNRLARDGICARLTTITDPSEVRAAIAEYGRLESSGWKGRRGTAVDADNAQGRFYADALEAYCASGDGVIYVYSYDGRAVALDLCIRNAHTLIVLKTTYDEGETSTSPATLMRYAAFGDLFSTAAVREIEFFGKVMDWHKRWTDEVRVLYHVNVYPNALLRHTHTWLSRSREPHVNHQR